MCIGMVENQLGNYEEFSERPELGDFVDDLKDDPGRANRWDSSTPPKGIREYEKMVDYHLRFCIGSVLQTAWQIRHG